MSQLTLLAHAVQNVYVPLTFALARKSRILVRVVNRSSIKIGQPRLDVAGRYEHCYSFVRLSRLKPPLASGIVKLAIAFREFAPVGVDDDN